MNIFSKLNLIIATFLVCFSAFAANQNAKTSNAKKHLVCNSSLGTLQDGESRTGYINSTSLPGVPCESQTVTCLDGALSGNPNLFPSCTTLNQDCGGTPHGGVMTGYQSAVKPCVPATVTCINGNWSGPKPISFCN